MKAVSWSFLALVMTAAFQLVEEGHRIAMEARRELLFRIPSFSQATIHVDPVLPSGGDRPCSGNRTPVCHEQSGGEDEEI